MALFHDLGVQPSVAYEASVSQIAIAYAINKGTYPIIGATKPRHVEEAATAAKIKLSNEEIEILGTLSAETGIVGKDGKGVIVTLTERSTNMLLMEKLSQGKHPGLLAEAVIRLLFPYRETIRTITTDNETEFCTP